MRNYRHHSHETLFGLKTPKRPVFTLNEHPKNNWIALTRSDNINDTRLILIEAVTINSAMESENVGEGVRNFKLLKCFMRKN